jgi:hypothetical protein
MAGMAAFALAAARLAVAARSASTPGYARAQTALDRLDRARV